MLRMIARTLMSSPRAAPPAASACRLRHAWRPGTASGEGSGFRLAEYPGVTLADQESTRP